MPYQPDGIWEEMSFGKNRYFRSNGDDLYRRSLYTFWRRTVAPASFFDVSARQVCEVRPLRTNTPLHALATLNDPTYVEAARVWAERLAADHPGDDARLGAAFRAATGRRPGEREMNALRRLLETARGHFARAPGEAAMLVAVGEAKRGTALPAAEHAAWTTVCLTILNSDEALSK
jgi:hypothetical protein